MWLKTLVDVHTQLFYTHTKIKIRKEVDSPCFHHISFTFSSTLPHRCLFRLVLGEFRSETHPDFPLILTSPSVTFPPLCSLYCVSSPIPTSLSHSLIFFISHLSLITLLTSAPIVINLAAWYGTAWIEMSVTACPFHGLCCSSTHLNTDQ